MAIDTIVRVDPKTLLVGPNVRKEVVLSKEFVASIKELCVRIPIVVEESSDGLVVVEGQRRTLAAVDLGLEAVPVFVRESTTDAERIIDQVVANEQRSELTLNDAVRAVQELALFDMKATAIAKRMGLPRNMVDQAVAVGSSKAARSALFDYDSRLEDAVLIAEFDEFPADQAEIMKVVEAGNSYNARTMAQAFKDQRQRTAVEAEIEALGLPLIKEPGWGQFDPLGLQYLYIDAEKANRLDDEPHERVVEIAGDGLCAYVDFDWENGKRVAVIRYAVKGWMNRGLVSYRTQGDSKATTPEEVEAEKAERRVARETTKAWVAASVLRVEFLQQLAQRRTPPAGWQQWVGARLLSNDTFPNQGWRMAIAILQLKETPDTYSMRGVVEKHFMAKPAAAAQIMLASVLGAIEGGFEFDRKGWQQEKTKAYLAQLAEWGYELSEVEQNVVKPKRARKAA